MSMLLTCVFVKHRAQILIIKNVARWTGQLCTHRLRPLPSAVLCNSCQTLLLHTAQLEGALLPDPSPRSVRLHSHDSGSHGTTGSGPSSEGSLTCTVLQLHAATWKFHSIRPRAEIPDFFPIMVERRRCRAADQDVPSSIWSGRYLHPALAVQQFLRRGHPEEHQFDVPELQPSQSVLCSGVRECLCRRTAASELCSTDRDRISGRC